MLNITSADYSLVENEHAELSQFYGVKYRSGKWKNVIVVYGKVSVKEDTVNDTAKMSFTYSIQDPADFDLEELREDVDFNNYIGEVLQFIIMDGLDNKGAQIGNIEPTTDTYSESPTE